MLVGAAEKRNYVAFGAIQSPSWVSECSFCGRQLSETNRDLVSRCRTVHQPNKLVVVNLNVVFTDSFATFSKKAGHELLDNNL